jgi:hypothetical protein
MSLRVPLTLTGAAIATAESKVAVKIVANRILFRLLKQESVSSLR